MDHVNYTKERISKALESLDWVHKALILHNDLCPRNILVVPGDPERVLVIDFDFAEVLPTKEAFDKPVQNAVGEWKDMKLGEWEDKILRDFGRILVCLFVPTSTFMIADFSVVRRRRVKGGLLLDIKFF